MFKMCNAASDAHKHNGKRKVTFFLLNFFFLVNMLLLKLKLNYSGWILRKDTS